MISDWFKTKYRTRAAKVGYFATATAMRKQGIPIEIAISILFNR